MMEGRDCQQWNHTAMLFTLIHNVNCDSKHQIRPEQVHPYIAASKSVADDGFVSAQTAICAANRFKD